MNTEKCIVCQKENAKPRYRTISQGFIAEGRAPLLCDECYEKEQKGDIELNFHERKGH